MDDQRYHLNLTTPANGTVMNGWWASRATAQRKFTSWIGSYSAMPGARITLAEPLDDGASRNCRAGRRRHSPVAQRPPVA